MHVRHGAALRKAAALRNRKAGALSRSGGACAELEVAAHAVSWPKPRLHQSLRTRWVPPLKRARLLQSTAATAARVEQLEAEAEAARVAHRAEAAALAAELGRTQEVPARHAPRAFQCQLLCWCLV